MTNRHIKLFFISLLLLGSLGFNSNTLAETNNIPKAEDNVRNGLDITAGSAKIDTTPKGEATITLGTIAGRFINYIFGIVGMIFVLIILIGAYLWMTARGSEEKIAKAKTFLLNGFLGLLVIFVAWGLVFVMANGLGGAIGAKK